MTRPGERVHSREIDKLTRLVGAMEAVRDHLDEQSDSLDIEVVRSACTRSADALDVMIDQTLVEFPHLRDQATERAK